MKQLRMFQYFLLVLVPAGEIYTTRTRRTFHPRKNHLIFSSRFLSPFYLLRCQILSHHISQILSDLALPKKKKNNWCLIFSIDLPQETVQITFKRSPVFCDVSNWIHLLCRWYISWILPRSHYWSRLKEIKTYSSQKKCFSFQIIVFHFRFETGRSNFDWVVSFLFFFPSINSGLIWISSSFLSFSYLTYDTMCCFAQSVFV